MNLSDILTWSAHLAGCDDVPADSQVYVEASSDVHRILFGIDISLAEVMWAQQKGFDAVIAHHPLGGSARTRLTEVVRRQVDQMSTEGIARDVAEKAVGARLAAIGRRLHVSNVNALVDGARLIGMPLCNVHLAADIITRNAIIELLRRRAEAASRVSDAIDWLNEEFAEYHLGHARPEVWAGSASNLLGRWTVAMAGGTNGGFPVFSEYFRVGVDTIFAMHIDEPDLQQLRATLDPTSALVITGHMPSDSIGINVIIAGLEERGIEVVRTGGLLASA